MGIIAYILVKVNVILAKYKHKYINKDMLRSEFGSIFLIRNAIFQKINDAFEVC